MIADDKILIRLFNDNGLERLTALINTSYPGSDISNQEYLGWEYMYNPDGLAVVSVAEKGGDIISHYAVLPRYFSIDKKIVYGSLSVNTLTHKDYRGQGLFEKLTSETFNYCIERKICFTIGFPNQVSHPVIRRKQIFETIGTLPLLLKPLNIVGPLLRYIKDRKNKSGEEIMLDHFSSELNKFERASLFDLKNDSEKYDNFLLEFNHQKQNVTNRSLQFLRWRYIHVPRRKYYILKIERENRISALIVFRAKYIYGLRAGIIIDCMSTGDGSEAKILLKVLEKTSLKNKLDILLTTAPRHSYEFSLIKNSGYYSMPGYLLPQKLAVIVKRHIDSCPPQVNDFRRWFLTFGDYDIF